MSYYFDDPDEGLSAETSHPKFRELAVDSFYYDCTDEFAPFGSDDGADTLAALQEWFRRGGRPERLPQFLVDLSSGWNLGVPAGLIQGSEAHKRAWLEQDRMHEPFLQSECRARIAVAFGQLKICGELHPEIQAEALASIACMLWLNERSQTANPQWGHAAEERAKLMKMKAVLGGL
ncbi:MolR family transcriptional regulator [Ideonella sp. BN130291]|uniref:MolR family transcriptional regulator n=1 Tax=Ideonella sp. BN130291 TaxID=3112940 RepID=UPI002E253948|nr:MolR family transcriptional regulator [Ideonella sp. BN130291]